MVFDNYTCKQEPTFANAHCCLVDLSSVRYKNSRWNEIKELIKSNYPIVPSLRILNNKSEKYDMEWSVGDEAIREFKIRWLRTTTTDKHATAHDQNHVTVHFSRVVLRLRWVVELFRVVGTTENILLVFCRSVIQESHIFVKKFAIHLL